MKQLRKGLGLLAVMAASAVALAMLLTQARDAFGLLAAQNDPAELADVRVNSVLRNSQKIVKEHIEAALEAGDADLANSFVELARAKNTPLSEDLSKRVGDAVAEQNSASHFAKNFASGS